MIPDRLWIDDGHEPMIPDPLEDNPYDMDHWDVDDSDEETCA